MKDVSTDIVSHLERIAAQLDAGCDRAERDPVAMAHVGRLSVAPSEVIVSAARRDAAIIRSAALLITGLRELSSGGFTRGGNDD